MTVNVWRKNEKKNWFRVNSSLKFLDIELAAIITDETTIFYMHS